MLKRVYKKLTVFINNKALIIQKRVNKHTLFGHYFRICVHRNYYHRFINIMVKIFKFKKYLAQK
jgi:hypothetical protein